MYLSTEHSITLYRHLVVDINFYEVKVNLTESDLDAFEFDFAKVMKEIKANRTGIWAALQIYACNDELERAVKEWSGFYMPHSAEKLCSWWKDGKAELQQQFESCASQPYFRAEQECAHLFHSLDNLTVRATEYRKHLQQIELARAFPERHDGYVYLFYLSSGQYKIGFSIDPQRRGREIVSGLPLTIDLIHAIWSNQIACLEYEFHCKYADKRWGKTEWFTLNQQDIEEFKSKSENLYDWVENPSRWQPILHPTSTATAPVLYHKQATSQEQSA